MHTATNAGGEIRGQLGKTLVPECLPTATFELNGQTLSVKIFPNPTADNVNIQFDSPESFDAQIVVSDLIGRQMMSKNVSILRGSNAVELDASVLNHGIYFVQMRDNKRLLFTEKIVKN